jgi:HK97 family phage major capsid protein
MTEVRTLPTLYRDVVLDADAVRVARDSADDRIPMSISSEYGVERGGFFSDPYVEVLSHDEGAVDLGRANGGLPLLMDHDHTRQIGVLEDVRVGPDKRLHGMARFSKSSAAQEIRQDVLDGIRTRTSIGYRVLELTQERKPSKTELALYRATRWALYENSIVSIPADPTVGAGRKADEAAFPVTVRSLDTENAPQGQEIPMSDKDTAAPQRAASDVPTVDRSSEIVNMCALADMPQRAAEFVNSGLSLDAIRAEVFAAKLARETAAPIPQVTGMIDRAESEPWAADGADFFRSVIKAGRGGAPDVRLLSQRTQSTVLGEDGGFAVPAPVVSMMLEATMTGGEILSRVTSRPITAGNSYTETLVKEESRVAGSRNGGVRAFWLAEDGSYTESKGATRQLDLKLQKLGALCKVTEEQMEDGPALVSWLNEQVPEELRFNAEQAIWEGDGAGKPLGAMTSGALVTVAIEGSQTIANTAGNIWVNAAKMYSRMPARSRANAAWFINDELWAKILTATAGTGAGAPPVFIVPGQIQQFPNGALYGRPIVPVEYASAEGTVGDFVFADFSDYVLAQKGGIRAQSSMHVDFVRDKQALKFTWRVNGAPRTRVPVTPFKGSASKSPYIALAARS